MYVRNRKERDQQSRKPKNTRRKKTGKIYRNHRENMTRDGKLCHKPRFLSRRHAEAPCPKPGIQPEKSFDYYTIGYFYILNYVWKLTYTICPKCALLQILLSKENI
jgi:hypothetical protein